MTYFKKTGIIDNYGNDIEGTMLPQLKVASSTRLAGGVFNYTATGTKIATLDNTKANIGAFLTNIPFDNGLTIVLSGTTDVTVVYE